MSVAPNPAPKNNSYWQQTFQNQMLLIVLSMIIFVPMLALPSNATMQYLANQCLILMAALLAGVLVLRAKVAKTSEQVVTFLSTGANLAVILFFLETVLTLFLAAPEVRKIAAADVMRVVTGTLLYFAMVYHIRRSEHLFKIQDGLVIASAAMALLGLGLLATPRGENTVQTFGDHQLYGAVMMILFPITIIAAITEKNQRRQIAIQVAAAITAICLVLSGTRTAWAGAGCEILALLALSMVAPKRKNQAARSLRPFIIPTLILLTCIGLFIALGNVSQSLGERFLSDSRRSALDYRARMNYAAGELIKQKPLFGHGIGSYPLYQSQFSTYGRSSEDLLKSRPSLGEMAHNFWLQLTAEQGLIGVSLFAAIVLSFFAAGFRRLRFLDGGIRRNLLLASMASLVGFCIDAVGNPAWQFGQVSMFLWLLLGVGVACARPRS